MCEKNYKFFSDKMMNDFILNPNPADYNLIIDHGCIEVIENKETVRRFLSEDLKKINDIASTILQKQLEFEDEETCKFYRACTLHSIRKCSRVLHKNNNLREKLDLLLSLFIAKMDSKNLFDMAKILAKDHSLYLVDNFDKFDFMNEENRIEIAKIAAHTNCVDFVNHAEKFQIENSNAILEIAKIILEKHESVFIDYIYMIIMEQKDWVEIAKFSVIKSPFMIAEYIDFFKIENQADLIEIMISIYKKEPLALICNINNFKIKDRELLMTIALDAAKNYPNPLAKNIDKFEIDNQQDLIAIAKIVYNWTFDKSMGFAQRFIKN